MDFFWQSNISAFLICCVGWLFLCQQSPSSESYCFFNSQVWIWELDYKESWAQKNWGCWTVVLEKTLRVTWTARRSSQPIQRGIPVLNIHWKDWCWRWNSNTLATWCKELTHWKRPRCWERLKVGGEGETEDGMVGWHHWLNGHEFE